MIAQMVTAHFPERVFSLTSMLSSSGRPHPMPPKPEALRIFMHRPRRSAGREAIIDHVVELFSVIGSPGYPTDRREMRSRISGWVERAYDPKATIRQLLAVVVTGDRRPLLNTITVPTLVIHGADDPLVPLEEGRDTARNVRGATLLVIDGMGHDLPNALVPRLVDAIDRHCQSQKALEATVQ